MVDMNKRIYDSGSLQGFNVVTHLYPTSDGSRGFCGGGSMDHVCMSYNDGELSWYAPTGARWYEVSYFNGDGYYDGVVCKGVSSRGMHSDRVVGHIGIGTGIDSACDGEIVDRVVMEWRVLMGSMQDME